MGGQAAEDIGKKIDFYTAKLAERINLVETYTNTQGL
jgi:hypothetical protein